LAREMQSVKYNVLDLDVINKASVVAEFSFFSEFFFDLPQIHCRESINHVFVNGSCESCCIHIFVSPTLSYNLGLNILQVRRILTTVACESTIG